MGKAMGFPRLVGRLPIFSIPADTGTPGTADLYLDQFPAKSVILRLSLRQKQP
jgi:hypothetical protein